MTAEARAADLHVLDCWAQGDHAAVCDFYPEYCRHAPEGRFAHYLMLLGAIGGRACTARGERYSDLRERAWHGSGPRGLRPRFTAVP